MFSLAPKSFIWDGQNLFFQLNPFPFMGVEQKPGGVGYEYRSLSSIPYTFQTG